MVKFVGKIGTIYQIFTPCTPLPKYIITTIFNAQERFFEKSRHDVQTKGRGGQRPFEQ